MTPNPLRNGHPAPFRLTSFRLTSSRLTPFRLAPFRLAVLLLASSVVSVSMPVDCSGSPWRHEIERIEIPVGDLTFQARACGPEDGPLVLLLHGFPETSYAFRSQLVALSALGLRAVAPDQRGYSPQAPPGGRFRVRGQTLAGDVLAMADALGADRFDLVGHD
ncbi:MAG: alpha/beta fold hydrolase [Candidatus Eisenbacteria bacterium]